MRPSTILTLTQPAILAGALALIVPAVATAQDDAPRPMSDDAAPGDAAQEDVPSNTEAAAGDTVERARALFTEGVGCVEARDFSCAEQRFRAALDLRDAPAVRYNLASALFELGRYPEAARLARSVLEDPESSETIRTHTQSLMTQLDESAGRLEIVVLDAPTTAEVRVDDENVPAAQLRDVHVAPGSRAVTLLEDERELARRTVEVERGARTEVELVAIPTPAEAAAEAHLEDDAAAEDAPPLVEDWRFWAAVGGGAVVLTVAIIVVAAAVSAGQGTIEGDYEPGVLRWD